MVVRSACLLVLTAGMLVSCDDGGSAPTGTPDVGPVDTAPVNPVSRSRVADNPAGWPPIEISPARLDFGLVAPGSTVSETVTVHNVGRDELHIFASSTSCGCTKLEPLKGRTIPPGASTSFDITMSPKSGLGEKREAIRIGFTGFETIIQYDFHAEVSLAVRAEPPHITAVNAMSGVIELTSQDGTPFRVLACDGRPPRYAAETPDDAQTTHRLVWDLTDADRADAVRWFWVIETDHPEAPVIDVRVRHDDTRPNVPRGRLWQPKDQRLNLGEMRNGAPVTVTTKIEFPSGAAIDPATAGVVNRSELPVRPASIVREGNYLVFNLVITPETYPAGLVYEEIDLHAQGYTSTLRLVGRVVE